MVYKFGDSLPSPPGFSTILLTLKAFFLFFGEQKNIFLKTHYRVFMKILSHRRGDRNAFGNQCKLAPPKKYPVKRF